MVMVIIDDEFNQLEHKKQYQWEYFLFLFVINIKFTVGKLMQFIELFSGEHAFDS